MESAIAHVVESEEQRTSDVAAGSTSFEELIVDRNILKGLQAHKFVTPTKIQAAAIPIAIAGMDLLVQSKSGTGKTLIYTLAAFHLLNLPPPKPQVLIIVPTRELAIQVEDTANGLSSEMRNPFRYVAVSYIGGTDVKKDRLRMAKARIVVGTPGRLLHLMRNRVFNTSCIKLVVLDEADQLYATPTLQKDVQTLLEPLLSKCQIIACSATYPDGLDERLATLMLNPILVSNSERATVLLGIRQFVYELPEQLNSMQEMMVKLGALRKIFDQLHYEQGILFASSQSRADSFRNYLQRNGVECDLMSGAMKQSDRLETFKAYRNFQTRTMVATDLMARGVDSSHANLVINLDPPKDLVTYLHRIGRAGRFGSKGIAITFISSPQQCQHFKRIILEAGTGMSVLQFPEEKRVGFDFWNFDAYDFPYFQKIEAQEQEEAELKRIKQRWKGKAEQTNEALEFPIEHLENEVDQKPAEDLQQVENSVGQEPNQTEVLISAQTADMVVIEATHQQSTKAVELVDQQGADEVEDAEETDCQLPVELILKANSIQEKPSDPEVPQENDAESKILVNDKPIQLENTDNIKSSLKSRTININIENHQETSIEPMELTPSTDIPAAAPNSINTKTYCLMAPTDRSSTTLLPLGISNTVDDASSIVSDSMENDYDSDASYSSVYTMSDARLIWRRALSQRILQRRRKCYKRRICLLSMRRVNLRVVKKPKKPSKRMIKIDLKGEEDRDVSTITERQNKKDKHLQNEESSKLSDKFLWVSKRFNFASLLNKFDNLSEMQQRLYTFFERTSMSLEKVDQWMVHLYDAMNHFYYVDHSKPRALQKPILPEICNLDNYKELMNFLNLKPCPYVEDIKREQPKQMTQNKLTVHVNQQVNIMPIIAVDGFDNAEETESDLSGSDLYSENESEGADSVEPYSSSGFVESTESASSGIETSQYGSNSSTELDSNDNEEEESSEEDKTSDEEDNDVETESSEHSLTLTADTDDNVTDHENEIEEENTDDDDTDNTVQNAADGDLALAQARWQHLFERQYQFIASYVDNYMATNRHQY